MTARAALNAVYPLAARWTADDEARIDRLDDLLTADPTEVARRESAALLDQIAAAGGEVA